MTKQFIDHIDIVTSHLYPNGNYNKTWCHEEMDDYLDI